MISLSLLRHLPLVRLLLVLSRIRTPFRLIRIRHRGLLSRLRVYRHHVVAAVRFRRNRASGREAMMTDHRNGLNLVNDLRAGTMIKNRENGPEVGMMYSRLERDLRAEMIRNREREIKEQR